MNNKVEYLGGYGGDLTHSLSAWTSTTRDLTCEKAERIPKLLEMLATNHHGTPFEKSAIHFLVTVDQASHIHALKHRIGTSINGESARYKELKEDKFYLPEDWKNYGGLGNNWYNRLKDFTEKANRNYHECLSDLVEAGMSKKRAKESARFFKTMNSQLDLDIMFNFRSFIHFYFLRSPDTAQMEIKAIAEKMLLQIKAIEGNPFEHSLKAFGL